MFDLRVARRRCTLAAPFMIAVVIFGCSSKDEGADRAAAGAAGTLGTTGGAQTGTSGAPSGGNMQPSEQGGGGAGNAAGAGGPMSGGRAGQGGDTTSIGDAGASGTVAFWKPSPGETWQWQLTGTIDQTVNASVFDIDGFDSDESVVKALHAKGRKVICYVSVGSFEDWRPDAKSFPAAVLGNEYPGWPGERFVDIRAKALRDIMADRLDLCQQKGFDGIEPDNMDVYAAKSGFPLTEMDGIDYANWLASEAHARGLNIGQKNAPEIAKQLEPNFDWVLTEDCFDQGWCADVSVYVEHQKPVFMSEYTDTGVDFSAACSWAKPKNYSPILKGRDLDAPVQFCP